ncbi:MAG: ABC transporter ATP-binding protein, partial [bacterium]|nr:ABC transporter ATP-binding protein [bacterium]
MNGEQGLIRRMWPFLKPDSWAFGLAVVLTPAAALLSLVQPYLLKRAIDDHVVAGISDGLLTLSLLYLGAVLLNYVLEGVYVMALAWGGQRTIVRMRSAIYRHILRLKQSYLDRQPAGQLLTR